MINILEITLKHGDCLKLMKEIPSESIDMILTDPPYGTTSCKWDTIIPLDKLWDECHRIIKPNGGVLLFSSQPFTTILNSSNIKEFRHEWIWEKEQGANFMNVKYQPYKVHETISVFSKEKCNYYPQMTEGKPYISGKGTSGDITGNVIKTQTKNNGTRYPRSIQKFTTDKAKGSFHPTQKPISLLEYLINTYSKQFETVLDFTMGSGSTGVACVNTNRNFYGIELDNTYFKIAEKRIADAKNTISQTT